MTTATKDTEDMDDWADFWAANEDELASLGERACRELAMNCSLFVGGGAGPLVRVGFVD
jgi:hypothetical protein